jgi:cobalt-zinc-cadmium efflux system outer membrane protein
LKHNPQVAAGLAGVAATLATYHSLGVPVPVALGASRITGTSTAPTLTGETSDTILDLAWTIDTSGQRRYQAAGANATFKATHFQFLETLLTLEQQVRDAYWSLAAASAQNDIAQISLTEAKRIFDLTVSQEKAGASPRGDVVRSSIDVANAKQTLLTAQSALKSALIVLNNLMGQPPESPVKLSANLSEESVPVPTINLPSLAVLNDLAKQVRPLLKSSDEQTRAAAYAVRQAESSRLPDLNVQYQRSVEQQVDALTLTVSIPILDFGGIGQTIKAAREQRKQAEAQRLQTQQQVTQQVSQAYSDLQIAVTAAASYKAEILTPSVTLLEMAKLGYQQGATGILPVIDAESTIRNARVGYINSLLAIYKAQDEILSAIGRLPDSVGGNLK